MDSEQFVEAVRQYVMAAAAEDTISNLENPPGRRVSPEERLQSDWFNALPDSEAAFVRRAVENAAHAAVFGLLAALDGARTIADEEGRFELRFVGRESTLLNPQSLDLYALLNARPAP